MNPAPRTIVLSLGIGLVTGGVWLIVAGAVFRFFQGENPPFALGAYCAMLLAPMGIGLYLLIGPSRLNLRFKSIFFLTGCTLIASVLGSFAISAWQLIGLLNS